MIRRAQFWGTAYVLLILLTGTNLPTPLYRGYEERFGFSPLVLTLIFASYVAVLIPCLLVAGSLSDAIGRRRVLMPAVGLAALGSLGFALATGTGWLFAARILQGLALGAASGPLIAALTELEPVGNRGKAALVSTVATAGGLGLGPLLGGVLAQYAPAPDVVPFVVEIVLLMPAAAALATLPTTRPPTRWRLRRPEIPRTMRPVFATSGTANLLAWAVTGLFLTFIPAYVITLSGSSNLMLGGSAVALMLTCSALAQLVGHDKPASPPGASWVAAAGHRARPAYLCLDHLTTIPAARRGRHCRHRPWTGLPRRCHRGKSRRSHRPARRSAVELLRDHLPRYRPSCDWRRIPRPSSSPGCACWRS